MDNETFDEIYVQLSICRSPVSGGYTEGLASIMCIGYVCVCVCVFCHCLVVQRAIAAWSSVVICGDSCSSGLSFSRRIADHYTIPCIDHMQSVAVEQHAHAHRGWSPIIRVFRSVYNSSAKTWMRLFWVSTYRRPTCSPFEIVFWFLQHYYSWFLLLGHGYKTPLPYLSRKLAYTKYMDTEWLVSCSDRSWERGSDHSLV